MRRNSVGERRRNERTPGRESKTTGGTVDRRGQAPWMEYARADVEVDAQDVSRTKSAWGAAVEEVECK